MPDTLGIDRSDAARTPRAGVVGAGYFGQRHAVRYGQLPNVVLSAVCDVETGRARELASRSGAEWAADYRQLVGKIDCVSIVTPTETHFEIAKFFLQQGIHVLVEKPMCHSVEQADMLILLAKRHRLVLNVGHVERFNPAVRALFEHLDRPRFIETRRLSPIRNGGNSSNVVMDLMIHDLDLVLQAMDDQVRWIEVELRQSPAGPGNHIMAQLEFRGGSSASLVAGYVSAYTERTMQVTQSDLSMEVDMYQGSLALHTPSRSGQAMGRQAANVVTRQYGVVGSLLAQIESFVRSVEGRSLCLKSANTARRALAIALSISAMIDSGTRGLEGPVEAARISR